MWYVDPMGTVFTEGLPFECAPPQESLYCGSFPRISRIRTKMPTTSVTDWLDHQSKRKLIEAKAEYWKARANRERCKVWSCYGWR